MNFLKPLCDKLRWFQPPLLGAGPVVPAGSRNHLTGINCCDWWTFGLCLGWGVDRAEAFGALPWFFTSSTTCISSFLPLIVRELHSQLFLLHLKSRSSKWINQVPKSLLWGDLPWREVKGPQLSETCWRLHSCYVYLPGRHWVSLRMDEPVEPHKYMNMKSATHWLNSRLCFTPWSNFPWLQHTRFK